MNAQADRIPLLPAEEHERRARRASSPHPHLWDLLDEVKDPELPVVSIWQLGILQDVSVDDGAVTVIITPTYSGCPAMDAIERDIVGHLATVGLHANVRSRLSPAWSTSWILDCARDALREYGIAPPSEATTPIQCPNCGSQDVRTVSEFGSTACKALLQCSSCREPFDHFKPF